MSIIKEILPQCDCCLKCFADSRCDSVKSVVKGMRADGWKKRQVRGRTLHICPDCVRDVSPADVLCNLEATAHRLAVKASERNPRSKPE